MSYLDILSYDHNVVLYRPELNKITGDPLTTILLCQIIYWSKKYKGEKFYKNIYTENKQAKKNQQKSFRAELGFNRYQIEKAVDKLCKLKLVEIKVERSTHNTFFKLNGELLEKRLTSVYERRKKRKIPNVEGEHSPNAEGKHSRMSKVNTRSITETTQRLPKKGCLITFKRDTADQYSFPSEYKIKKNLNELAVEGKIRVKERLKAFLKKYPQMGTKKVFELAVLHSFITAEKNKEK